jgi:hypothetical protein
MTVKTMKIISRLSQKQRQLAIDAIRWYKLGVLEYYGTYKLVEANETIEALQQLEVKG